MLGLARRQRDHLIDTGPTGSADAIAAALAEDGLDRDAIVRVVLTHSHEDHAGSAAAVRAWAAAEVVAHAADASVIRGEVAGRMPALLPVEEMLFAQVTEGRGLPPGLPAAPPCPVDREVADGDVLPLGGGAHVVHGPGHTDGSIALHLPHPRVLFTGDTVAENGGAVFLGPFNLDRTHAMTSFRRLVALDVDIALVGHGEPADAAGLRSAVPGPFAE